MRSIVLFILILILLLIACHTTRRSDDPRPNIILILADDLGYGDLGCYGQEKMETPNIDALAANGIRFTQFYSGSPVCAPSRCVLLTGKHTGHAYVRDNDEWGDRGDVWDYLGMLRDSTLEGQRPMPVEEITVGEVLQDAGYKTAIVGKWGLGAPHTESTPNKQGFEFFYGYNCQRQAHTYYPLHLYENEKRVYLNNDTVAPHTAFSSGADPFDPESYSPFTLEEYAPDLMFSEILNFVDLNKDRPFFLYWATPIPHVPIQAPKRWVDHYIKKFGDESPYTGDQGYFPHQYPHAGYAAMISYLDEQVGALIDRLESLGLHEKTLILFTSDNGPATGGGSDSPWFPSAGPFKSEPGYGKGYLHEGGIRVPLIACWPGKMEAGSVSNHISAFWDIFPTLCEAAAITVPAEMDGISLLPTLTGQGNQAKHNYLYWEFPSYGGQRAVRIANWKAIQKNMADGDTSIMLYDLVSDPQEQNDVSSDYPVIINQVKEIFRKAHVQSEMEDFRMELLGDEMEKEIKAPLGSD